MKGGSQTRNDIYQSSRKERKVDRDYTRLLADNALVPTPQAQGSGRTEERTFKEDGEDEDISHERQEYVDRRRRLKELERQKLIKVRNGIYLNGNKEESKAGRGHGGATIKGNTFPSYTKEKEALPYDRSFGSFFGPSEPVVAKRIIEEARAREEAENAASREAKAIREAERKKSAEYAMKKCLQKPNHAQRPPVKSCYKVNDKARRLKEARDYSFLFDDSPSPDPKSLEKNISAISKPGVADGRKSCKTGSVQLNSGPLRKPAPVTQSKSSLVAKASDKPSRPSRLGQHQSKLSQSLEKLPSSEAVHHHHASQTRSKLSPAKAMHTKVPSGGSGMPFPREYGDHKDKMRKLESELTLPNAGKIVPVDKHPFTSQPLDRRPLRSLGKHFAEEPIERVPAKSTAKRAVQTPNRQCAQTPDRRTASFRGRQPVSSSVAGRVQVVSEFGGLNLKPKLVPKLSSRHETIDKNRTGYCDDHGQDATQHKEGRSSRKQTDGLRRNLVRMKGNTRSPDEEEDDSFIDDSDSVGNVSSMIHKLMGYNPNKYHENDDFDDRSMEVGFRTIQAEERRSAREARLEDERELALIEAEEREERLRKAKKKRKLSTR